MHEFALAESIARIVTEHARSLVRVDAIVLSIGSLAGVESEALVFALQAVLRATPAEGARIELETLAALALCGKCGHHQAIEQRFDPCLQCGAFGLQLTEGDALRVLRVLGQAREAA